MSSFLQSAIHKIEAGAHTIEDKVEHIAHGGARIVHSAENAVKSDLEHAANAVRRTGKAVIGGVQDDIHQVEDAVVHDAQVIGSDVAHVLGAIPPKLAGAGHYIQNAVVSAADTISDVEDRILPSPSSVITETGLLIAGVIAAAFVVLKVV